MRKPAHAALCLIVGLLSCLPLLATAAPLEKVVLQLKWQHAFQFAGYYAAKAQGYYAAEGLDVTLRERDPKQVVVEQVTGGQADYGVGDSGILASYATGKPIVALAAIFQHSPLVFISRRDSGVISPYEMAGKRIMFDGRSQDEAPLISMLAAANVLPGKYIAVPHSFSNDDLIAGRVDVMSAYLTDSVFYLRKMGIPISIINPQNYGLDFYGDLLFTSDSELRAHPGRAERFVRASLKGWQYALDHPEEVIQLIIKEYQCRNSLEHLRFEAAEMRKLILPEAIPLGQIEVARLRRVATIYAEHKFAPPLSERQLRQFVFNMRRSTELTQEEHAWLRAHPVIRVGIDRDFVPYEWIDAQDEFVGLNADILKLLEKNLGVRFEVIKGKTWQQTLDMARAGELDMLTDAVDTPERHTYLGFTPPYIQSPIVIVNDGRNGYIGDLRHLYGKRVAVKQGYFMQEVLTREHPQITLLTTPDEASAFDLLKNDKADAYVGDAPSLNYLIQQTGELTLRFSGTTEYTSAHSMAVTHRHPELLSILGKALAAIPQSQHDEILNRWMGLRIESGLSMKTALRYGVAALAALLLLALWIHQLRREVAARKAAEAALEQHRNQLETLVEVRTADLSLAKDAAETANRTKSVFLANMSHELRTPLNAILGYARLVERDNTLGEETRKRVATINRSGQHLLAMINDVLEISRIETGGGKSQRQSFDLAKSLKEIEEMIRVRADDKGLVFHVEHTEDLPAFVRGDKVHLKQVLINLLGNAVKYTEHGSVRLGVSRLHGARTDQFSFEVSDTGPGISAEDLSHIFQPFYQTEVGIAKGEGTGLGLAISSEYAKMMGGQLQVRSQPGQGSVFTLCLALPEVDAAPVREMPGRVIGLEPGQEGLRVLVVDDKADNCELVRQHLEDVGFSVRTALDGQQAVALYQSWQPCFIWMDMRMPVLDGYQATRQIRQLPGGDKIKIVALTASAFEEDRQKVLDAGCNDLVRKPIEEEELFAVMGELLGLHYRYARAEAAQSMPLVDIDLSVLPPDLLRQLKDAAEALDLSTTRQTVATIGESHPALAAALDAQLKAFQFDRIVALCQET